MINLVLHPGEKVRVRLHEEAGGFVINHELDSVTIICSRHRSEPAQVIHDGEIFAVEDPDEADELIAANERSDEENWADGTIADGMRAYDRSRREP